MKYVILLTVFKCIFIYGTIAQSTFISGTILNYPSTEATISSKHHSAIKKMTIHEDGSFHDSLDVIPGYYQLSFGQQYASLFLEPGMNIQIKVDMNDFDQSIVFSGKGSTENNFITELYLFEEKIKADSDQNMNEDQFLKHNESLFQSKQKLLKQKKGLSKTFRLLAQKNIELENVYAIDMYPVFYQMHDANYKPSKNYPDPFAHFDLENEQLITIPNYSMLIQKLISLKIISKLNMHPEKDFFCEFIQVLDSMVESAIIKESVITGMVYFGYQNSKDLDCFHQGFKKLVTDSAIIQQADNTYSKLQHLAKGKPSLPFTFKDDHDRAISLSDFRGKYVYIDVWATWCAPCRGEIPYLKSLTMNLKDKNIVFVSIAMNDNKTKWLEMLKEKSMEGVQLFAENSKDPFFKHYLITGIPRFILIDPDGNIVDSNAKRPSDPALLSYLEKML